MKNKYSVILLALYLFLFSSCNLSYENSNRDLSGNESCFESEVSAFESSESSKTEDDFTEQVTYIYEKYKVFLEIYQSTLHYQKIDNPDSDLKDYNIVDDERFKSLADIKSYFESLFNKEIADVYYNVITESHTGVGVYSPEIYKEKDNVLYILKHEIDYAYIGDWNFSSLKTKQNDDGSIWLSVPIFMEGKGSIIYYLKIVEKDNGWMIDYFNVTDYR